jgi:two-component system, NarL family, sensor histidine kinase UhpB
MGKSLAEEVLQAANLVTHMGESLTRFNLLEKTTSEGVWDFNLLTGEVYYNETIYALLGYSEQDMVDNITWWQSNIHPNDKKRVTNEIDDLLAGSANTWWGEYSFRCKNGSYKKVFERLYIVRNPEGKAIRLIGSMMDLTPLNNLQQQMEEERITYRNEIMRRSINSSEQDRKEISDELHENINQVLAAINLHIEAAKEHMNPQGAEWLRSAQDLLIDSMNGIRKLSKRLSPLSLKSFGLIHTMSDLLADFSARTGIDYSFDYEKSLQNILSDNKKLLLYRMLGEYLKIIGTKEVVSFIHLQLNKEKEKDKVKLSIADNEAVTTGYDNLPPSFSSMQMMAEAYNGSLHYHCKPAQGCLLEIFL